MSGTDMSRTRPVVDFGIGDQKRRARPAGVLGPYAGLTLPGETPSVTGRGTEDGGEGYLD